MNMNEHELGTEVASVSGEMVGKVVDKSTRTQVSVVLGELIDTIEKTTSKDDSTENLVSSAVQDKDRNSEQEEADFFINTLYTL